MKYRSTKTYGHDIGLSATFRQWRSDSHCAQLHGYALAVHLEFEAARLDDRNWVIDFGALKPVKAWLADMFDHRTLVAVDDPQYSAFVALEHAGLINMRTVQATGCEAFAVMIAAYVQQWLRDAGHAPRVRLAEVHVREHGSNSGKVIL